jgi:phosphoribosyl 1,2-cyclic phosphodiesterase
MTVMPFDVQHDAEEPLGFLVYSNETGEKLLYLADTFYCKYKFKGLNYILIECNYDKEILEQNIENGAVPGLLRRRLLRSHFSIDNIIKFLKANDLSKIQDIYLIHMSNQNADEQRFKKAIQELTGRQVIVHGG